MMPDRAAIRAEADRLYTALQATGAQPVEADILLPAGTLLDLYGEDIRARAYVTQDPIRGEMMLRPDFTVPVVQMHMAHGAEPARYCYRGEVFRKQDHVEARASEYLQVGYEVFARDNPPHADAEVFALFSRLLAPLNLRPATGDMGLIFSAVRGLETSRPPQGRPSAPCLAARPLPRAARPFRRPHARVTCPRSACSTACGPTRPRR